MLTKLIDLSRLKGGLLRQPEQEVAERLAGIQPGEDEGAAGIRIRPAVGADVAEVAAEPDGVRAVRLPIESPIDVV